MIDTETEQWKVARIHDISRPKPRPEPETTPGPGTGTIRRLLTRLPPGTARRAGLGIGAALLVGGWGITRYAVQQGELAAGAWLRETNFGPPGRMVFAVGVVLMAIGAGIAAVTVWPCPRRHE